MVEEAVWNSATYNKRRGMNNFAQPLDGAAVSVTSADPQLWPVVIIVFAPVVRPSPIFKNLGKQNEFQAKTMFSTGETVGLAEWIIDDSCLVASIFRALVGSNFSSQVLKELWVKSTGNKNKLFVFNEEKRWSKSSKFYNL